MSGFAPKYLILHDYGGKPTNADGMFNPYHALVFPDGSIRHRYQGDPYGQSAPHAYRLNPEAIGLSYADQVGSTPTPAAMETLRREFDAIKARFPDLRVMGHGEASHSGLPATRTSRDLIEAQWRAQLLNPDAPSTNVASSTEPQGQTPVTARGITTFAGMTPPPAAGPRLGSLATAEAPAWPASVSLEGPAQPATPATPASIFGSLSGAAGDRQYTNASNSPVADQIPMAMAPAVRPRIDTQRLRAAIARMGTLGINRGA